MERNFGWITKTLFIYLYFVKCHIQVHATPNSPKIFVRQFIHLSVLNSWHWFLTSVRVTYRVVYTTQHSNMWLVENLSRGEIFRPRKWNVALIIINSLLGTCRKHRAWDYWNKKISLAETPNLEKCCSEIFEGKFGNPVINLKVLNWSTMGIKNWVILEHFADRLRIVFEAQQELSLEGNFNSWRVRFIFRIWIFNPEKLVR